MKEGNFEFPLLALNLEWEKIRDERKKGIGRSCVKPPKRVHTDPKK